MSNLSSYEVLHKLYNTTIDYLVGVINDDTINCKENNAKEILSLSSLHWDGIALTESDLQMVYDLLEEVVTKRNSQSKKNIRQS